MKIFRTVLCICTAVLCSAALWGQNYTWNGTSGSLTDSANWTPPLPPSTPPYTLPTGTYTVNSGTPYLPTTAACQANVILNIGSGAVLDLQEYDFFGNNPVINISGTLKLQGTSTQKDLFSFYISLKSGCTVEYTSGGATDDVYGGPYQNLRINRSINAGSPLTVNGKTTVNAGAHVTIRAATQTYNDNISFSAPITFDVSGTLNAKKELTCSTSPKKTLNFTGGGNAVVEGSVQSGVLDAENINSLTFKGSVSVDGALKTKNWTVQTPSITAASVSVNGTTAINQNTTIRAATQNYKGALTLTADTNFAVSGTLIFEQHASVFTNDGVTLKFSGGGVVTAQESITAGSIDASGITRLEIKKPVTVKNGLTVNNFTIEAAQVKAENGDILVNGQTLINNPTPVSQIKVTAKRQTYGAALNISANDTYFEAEQNLSFKPGASIYAPNKTITLASLTGIVSTQSSITGGDITLKTNSGTIETKSQITADILHADVTSTSGKLIIKAPIKLSNKFEQTGNGAVQIGAPVTDNAAVPAELPSNKISFTSKNIYFTDTASLDPSHITKHADCNIFIGTSLTLKNHLNCANFVLYGGTVTFASASSGVTASHDIVLFGNAYTAADAETGVANLFSYHNSARAGKTATASVNWGAAFPAGKLPDGSPAPEFVGASYSGAFSDLNGKTLTVGKNFYANGMTLTSSGSWTLSIPDNNNATAGFAEAYKTTVQNCTAGPGWVSAAEGSSVSGTSPHWDVDRPTIVNAYTVSDDTIYVEFSEPIENSNNEISKALANIKYHNGSYAFSEARMVRADGTPDNTAAGLTDGKGDIKKFFLRTAGYRWNTDATGNSAGSADSTDRGSWQGNQAPEHRTVIPDLNIPKALGSLYETLRDEHKNRIRHYNGSARFIGAEDKCPPVLAAVYTGQEQHTQNPAFQADCDAHNFIEFRYSEPVYIGGSGTGEDIAESAVNQLVTDALGKITAFGSGLKIAGLATIAGGSVDTRFLFPSALSPPPSQPNTLYRKFAVTSVAPPAPPQQAVQECRVRISIAGYTEGSVTVGGVSCKKWLGYIESATVPAVGTEVTVLALGGSDGGVNIRERKPAGLEIDRSVKRKISTPPNANYGTWDTSAPVCAKAANTITDWTSSSSQKEVTVYSSSSRFADKMEFHFFDNTPQYSSSEPWWKTPKAAIAAPGWSNNSNRYDSYGGSRLSGGNRTSGGIRACTLTDGTNVNIAKAFNFVASTAQLNAELQKFRGLVAGVNVAVSQKTENGALYGPIPSGFSSSDTLYLQFRLNSASTFPVTETFNVQYDNSVGKITDLAGNKMKSFTSNAGSINAAPPNIGLTVAPVGTNRMFILFTSQLNTSSQALAKIPGNLEITGVGTLQVNAAVPATVATDTQKGTGIIVSLNGNVPYSALQNAQVKVKPDASHTVFIEPKFGGFPSVAGHAHAISDFAVNVVQPLYAFDNKKLDDGTSGFITEGLYGTNSHAVRLFDGSGAPGNTVLEKEDITLNVAVENVEAAQMPANLKLFIDNTPKPSSVSKEFNELTGLNSRIWLPAISNAVDPAFPASGVTSILPTISAQSNDCSSKEIITGTHSAGSQTYSFSLPNNPNTSQSLNYPAKSTASFLFPMKKNNGDYVTIDHDADSSTPEVPLYALRLKNPEDPSSIDLWSFDISAIKRQRGGVSILNNVINTNVKENTVIEVDMSRSGILSITVMSLDGSVVKILHSGYAEEGKHLYRWNGTNASGDSVARGMYFIRVAGPDIDETRKVMAVSD